MGQCISWDRRKSIWALRILSEVFLCTGIVACVAAFTIEQGKPNIYFLVSGFCLFLFAAIGLASSFCLSHDGKKAEKHPVHTIILPSAAGSAVPDASIISAIMAAKGVDGGGLNPIFNSMKSIPVDSVHSEAPKNYKQKKYGSKASDRLSSINEIRSINSKGSKGHTDSTSDEGFNSGNQSPECPNTDAERKKRRRPRRPQSADRSKSTSSEPRRKQSAKEPTYLSRI